jgi:hypothetical protein
MKGIVSYDFSKYNVKVSEESLVRSHGSFEANVGKGPREKDQ